MPDREGDPALQPDECGWRPDNRNRPIPAGGTRCTNIATVHEDWESETLECRVCGMRYTLYDDEMR